MPEQPLANSQKLTALYLIHGINGYEGSWQEKGNAVDSLEKQIREGRCEPMILIMPDCNKWPLKPHPGKRNLWKSLIRYPKISHEHQIEHAVSDLIDKIDTTYNVSSCVIAGLSDGARVAANVANLRPDRISAVGLFSPVLHKEQLPKDSIQMYYIYVGKKDIFKANGIRFHKRLKKAGYTHRFLEMRGSHNWRMWSNCLSDYLEQISNTTGRWSE